MSKYQRIENYSLRDILNILGEEAAHGTEFHVHYNKEVISENPFPFPFRSSNIAIMLVLCGKMKVQIDLETFIVSPKDVMVFSSQSIIHIQEIIEPVQSIGFVFTEEFALSNILNYEDIRLFRFTELNQTPILSLTEENYSIILDIMTKMYKLNLSQSETNLYKNAKVFHHFNLLALEMMEMHRTRGNQADVKTSRKKQIIHDFLSLLSIHIRKNRNVQFYADKLFITSGHLSKLLKEATGNTSREIIEEAVVMEARNLLMETSYSLAEIAEILNFSDQSFFGKFFKKKMKITPKSFRDKYK
ncbi:helix-turn-helix domain-containing protein [Flavobacterium gelatinilyticum]|uniref:helix-turn-helix domain-containing protein n=1 Tax=Flavobacterium gelatinilyticum TaxID=3003260 RepID=UPI002480A2B5|nr:helix-turn-helix domain-containing protein [Flavobacterium gelatinilyticum]